jgi:hypothetical protein
MQLYVPPAEGARTKILCCHHDDSIRGHFGVQPILELVARKYYWLGMAREVKAYTQACSTFQHVHPVLYRLHGSIEQLPKPVAHGQIFWWISFLAFQLATGSAMSSPIMLSLLSLIYTLSKSATSPAKIR